MQQEVIDELREELEACRILYAEDVDALKDEVNELTAQLERGVGDVGPGGDASWPARPTSMSSLHTRERQSLAIETRLAPGPARFCSTKKTTRRTAVHT